MARWVGVTKGELQLKEQCLWRPGNKRKRPTQGTEGPLWLEARDWEQKQEGSRSEVVKTTLAAAKNERTGLHGRQGDQRGGHLRNTHGRDSGLERSNGDGVRKTGLKNTLSEEGSLVKLTGPHPQRKELRERNWAGRQKGQFKDTDAEF